MADPLAVLAFVWLVWGRYDSWCEPVLYVGGIPRPAPLYSECLDHHPHDVEEEKDG